MSLYLRSHLVLLLDIVEHSEHDLNSLHPKQQVERTCAYDEINVGLGQALDETALVLCQMIVEH